MGEEKTARRLPEKTVESDGRRWPLGSADTVQWMNEGRTIDLTITSAMAPVFDAYATVNDLADEGDDDAIDSSAVPSADHRTEVAPPERPFTIFHSRKTESTDDIQRADHNTPAGADRYDASYRERLVKHLARYGTPSWWLGYLDTGSTELPFPDAPKVTVGPGWNYLLVQAGPAQALAWTPQLPELMFPTDHSWCVHTLWDDSWTCIGGPDDLIQALHRDDLLQGRRVQLGEDATPPGKTAF